MHKSRHTPSSKSLSSQALAKQYPQAARLQAVCLLLRIQAGESLNQIGFAHYPAAIRSYLQQIVLGTLREYESLCVQRDALLSKPLNASAAPMNASLLLALYEIGHMHTADYAAVNEWVNTVKYWKLPWAAGMMNGILRRILREGLPSVNDNESAHHCLPSWLLKRFKAAYPTQWQSLSQTYRHPPKLMLRLPQQTLPQDYLTLLKAQYIEAELHPVLPQTVIINASVKIDDLPHFSHSGIAIQDAAAQLAAILLAPKADERLLDACAAPGGKTGHLIDLQPKLKKLIAIDNEASRQQRTQQNLERLFGEIPAFVTLITEDVLTHQLEPDDLYDAILLDAPCSATGILHRHPDIKLLRRPTDIQTLTQLQKQLLKHSINLLKSGGRLLYATCSILPEENTEQIAGLLKECDTLTCTPLPFFTGLNIAETPHGLQLLPKTGLHDGFYYCLLQKM